MRNTLFLLIFIPLFNMIGCNNSENYIFTELFKYENITKDQEVTSIYIIDEKNGILLGEDRRFSDENAINFPSIVLNTLDGGKHFSSQTLGNGSLRSLTISALEENLFITQFVYDENSGSIDCCNIFRSNNNGGTWENISSFKGSRLNRILFYNADWGFASVTKEDTKANILLETKDGGKNWSLCNHICLADKKCHIITPDGHMIGNYLNDERIIWMYDIFTSEIKSKRLNITEEHLIDGYIKIDPITHQLFASVREKEWSNSCRYILYNITNDEQIYTKFPIDEFSVYGNYISVVSWLNDNNFKSIYCYSQDAGKTWFKEKPKCMLLSQYAIYGKGYFWSIAELFDDLAWPLMIRIPM